MFRAAAALDPSNIDVYNCFITTSAYQLPPFNDSDRRQTLDTRHQTHVRRRVGLRRTVGHAVVCDVADRQPMLRRSAAAGWSYRLPPDIVPPDFRNVDPQPPPRNTISHPLRAFTR